MTKGNSKADSSQGTGPISPKLQMVSAEVSDTGSMEKIRDILFGNQMRDYEKRFARMEENIGKELSQLKEENRKRMEDLEVFFKKEMGVLKDRLKSESSSRGEVEKKLLQEIKGNTESHNKKIGKLEEQFTERATDLQEQILDQSKKLSDDIQDKYDQSSKNLKEAVHELSDSKVDRSALAESLVEIAMRMAGNQNYESLINPKD